MKNFNYVLREEDDDPTPPAPVAPPAGDEVTEAPKEGKKE